MPWAVRKQGNGWVVVKKTTGKVVGHHATKKSAERQLRALYANVKE